MKKFSILSVAMLLCAMAMAAPVKNLPVKRVQPKGDTLCCRVSGDEFFHRLHDAKGYTIVQNPETGWYVYATVENGRLVPTQWVPGVDNPAQHGLVPGLQPDASVLRRMRQAWEVPPQYRTGPSMTGGANHGTLNNIVIFIRFSDETVCTTDGFSTINTMFNDSTTGATSMYDYFKKTSYNKLHVVTHYFPTPSGNTVLSYQDTFPRSYYQPYSSTNTNGYSTSTERRNREFGLLQRAVTWVNANSPVPTSLNLDMDSDGCIDNVCFVVSGTYTGWSDLLWPHKWSLYDRYVYINSKRVYTFNLQLAGSGEHYFSVSTFCHEMTHTLGSPDLYHYNNYIDVSAAGSWDLMHSDGTPPQQSNSLLKLKYLNWLDSIPLLTDSGTYTMTSLVSGPNNAYKIASANSHQWYILEYRNAADTFDSSIPNRGMLIWRYNDLNSADNVDFDNSSTPHEMWLFRPNSTDDITNGTISAAGFGTNGRTSFCSTSNPHPYLCNGTPDTSFSITNITISSDHNSVSFTFNPNGGGGGGTTCDTVRTFPTAQDFESADIGCWTFVSNNTANALDAGSNSACIYSSSTYVHGGDYCFRFSSYYSANDYNQYLISPRLEAQNPLHLQFYYKKNSSGSSESFRVLYSTTTNAPSAFTDTLTNVTVTSSSSFALCDLLVPANARHVAINYHSNYKYYLYVDDITLRDTLNTTYTITATSNQPAMGSVTGSGTYNQGRQVTLAAVPNTGYRFVNWTWNGGSSTSNPLAFSATEDLTVYANFEAETYTVAISPNDAACGTVTGSGVYAYLATVTATATPCSGYRFAEWSDGETSNPYSFTVTDDISLQAIFMPEEDTTTYLLSVSANDAAMGTVTGGGRYAPGTTVTIEATPYEGYRFVNWDDGTTSASRQVVVVSDTTFTAIFGSIEGIDEVAATSVSFLPNPVGKGQTLTLSATGAESIHATMTIYDVYGRAVRKIEVATASASFVADFPTGIYTILLQGDKLHSVQRVVVR